MSKDWKQEYYLECEKYKALEKLVSEVKEKLRAEYLEKLRLESTALENEKSDKIIEQLAIQLEGLNTRNNDLKQEIFECDKIIRRLTGGLTWTKDFKQRLKRNIRAVEK